MKIALASVGVVVMMTGISWLAEPVSLPVGAVIALAVLPTAELSAASAEIMQAVTRKAEKKG